VAIPDGLLEKMTLDEKIGQLTMTSANQAVTGPVAPADFSAAVRSARVGSLLNIWGVEQTRAAQKLAVEGSRLGIPLFFGADVIHGFKTVQPIPLAEAGAFDPDLWEKTARYAGLEAAAAGVHVNFSPMLDVSRDPRWGRIAEGPGEDAHVASVFAAAKVRGFQGTQLAPLAATVKHFAAYGAVAAGREYAAVDISDRALAEIYLPPFLAAVVAGAAAIMPAFTTLAGIPMTAHRRLITGLLRETWGFSGLVISDYNAISELIKHGVAADHVEAAALALNAGVDIDMMGFAYERGLPEALKRGTVTMAAIDAAVMRVFALKDRLGLFDDPYGIRSGPVPSPAEHKAVARESAVRSLVLAKNRGDLLPLSPQFKRIAVIGPLADAPSEMLGPWSAAGVGAAAVSVLAGLRTALPAADIVHVAGTSISGDADTIAEAVAAARSADCVILCVGEAALMSGEAASRSHLDLPGRQQELADAVIAAGKPVIAVVFSGRPLAIPRLAAAAGALLLAGFPGSEAGNAIADVLTGNANPSGHLAVTWPRDVGQVPIAYDARPTGRPENPADKYTSKYLDVPNSPEFPFGHGLSYSAFRTSDPKVTVADSVTVEISVTNESERAGTTTLFLFVHDTIASVSPPLLELKRFLSLTLSPREGRRVSFTLERKDFAFLDANLQPVVEPGDFDVYVGFSADPMQLRSASFRLA
jgi:beta-glucosidase